METQKSLLKNNDYAVVIDNLKAYLEADEVESNKAPGRACHRYLSNHTNWLDYKGVIEEAFAYWLRRNRKRTPLCHSKRLKLPGAWWKAANVEPMPTLRVARANDEWNELLGKFIRSSLIIRLFQDTSKLFSYAFVALPGGGRPLLHRAMR